MEQHSLAMEEQAQIWKYVFGFVDSAVAKCAIELGLVDILESHGSPMTLSQLCASLHHPPKEPATLNRIMRFLAHKGLISTRTDSNGATWARVAMRALLNGCDGLFKDVNSVVDVGGGTGTALRATIEAYPHIRGINFDLPHVVDACVEQQGVVHMGGGMFVAIPKADVALLMTEECIAILKNCREAIPMERRKVVIVEIVIREEEKQELSDTRLALDMIMLAPTNTGKEKTAQEWSHVLCEA
ncbi:hypothetical protein AMTRI_Chr01g135200 [Amborella trichopoda]